MTDAQNARHRDTLGLLRNGRIRVDLPDSGYAGTLTGWAMDETDRVPVVLVIHVAPRSYRQPSSGDIIEPKPYDVIIPWHSIRSYRCTPPDTP